MKRACQTIIALCLPLLLCGQVQAQHSGPYVGAFLGGNALMNAKSSDDQGEFSSRSIRLCRGAPSSGGTLSRAIL